MKKFNINHTMYVQITDAGWEHLKKDVGEDYIKHCILPYKREIDNEEWYALQCHSVFELLPISFGGQMLFNTNVMFDDHELE